MQLVALGCQEQKALAPVVNANFLINIALVDEFTQNTRELCLVTRNMFRRSAILNPGLHRQNAIRGDGPARNRVFVKWHLDLK